MPEEPSTCSAQRPSPSSRPSARARWSYWGSGSASTASKSSPSSTTSLPSHSANHEVSEDGTESAEDGGEKKSCRKLFACPYVKRTPWEYEERQSCSESGWSTILRLRYALRPTAYSRTDRRPRKHIYRCHILPIKCPSCSQNFESTLMFTHHLHMEPRCNSSLDEADEPIKGLESLLQKMQLTKIPLSNPSEEDMWRAIYTTLFPNDPKDKIPCPCEYPPRL